MSARKRKTAPGDVWVAHTREMRESPAWRYLPDTARRVLALFELEHMRCGGAKNGGLVLTYTAIAQGKVRRKSISLAIRQCEALGFLRITRRGARHGRRKTSPIEVPPDLPCRHEKEPRADPRMAGAQDRIRGGRSPGRHPPPGGKTRGENAPYARGENAPGPGGAGPRSRGENAPLSRYSSHSAAVDAPEASPQRAPSPAAGLRRNPRPPRRHSCRAAPPAGA